jgi:hypothetical protein
MDWSSPLKQKPSAISTHPFATWAGREQNLKKSTELSEKSNKIEYTYLQFCISFATVIR